VVATISFVAIVDMLCWRILIPRRLAEILSISAGFVRITMTFRSLPATDDIGPPDNPKSL